MTKHFGRVASAVLVAVGLSGCDYIARVNVDTEGTTASDGADDPAISDDGRYIAFTSNAADLVADDTNGTVGDVFVRDTRTGTTRVASVDNDGNQRSSFGAENADISGDGRFVVFASLDRYTLDTNFTMHVYVRDMVAGTTQMVDVDIDGGLPAGEAFDASISDDGRYVAFESTAADLVPGDNTDFLDQDVFVRDLVLGSTIRASVDTGGSDPNGSSFLPRVTSGGRFVLFHSDASDLVAGDTNGEFDVFLRDTVMAQTMLVSRTVASQANGPSRALQVSTDGRYALFTSEATNLVVDDTNGLVDLYRRDLDTGVIAKVDVTAQGSGSSGAVSQGSMSADGRLVVFATAAGDIVGGDTNGVSDIFVRDFGSTVGCAVGASAWTPSGTRPTARV